LPAFFYIMLNLILGNNTKAVSLNERITLVNPFFLLVLIDSQKTTDVKIMLVVDVAPAVNRLNEIEIELVANQGAEDLANGKVFLVTGDYNYEIYESANAALDITGKNRIQRGLAKFAVDTNEVQKEYNDIPDEKIYKG